MLITRYKNTINLVNKLSQSINHARYTSTQTKSCEEIRIPMPWGYVAGKWWGPQDKRPILLMHGWQDNCGSFDTLVPHLPDHVGYLAIDSPGHGLSSQLPAGVFYHGIDGVTLIRRVIQYFSWPKVSLMGHSLGAITNFTYTMLYPNTVDFLICLDGLKPLMIEGNKIEKMVKTMENFIKYDHLSSLKGEPPSYLFEELERKLHEGTRKSIALESCKYILKRNIAPSTKEPNKYYFSRDARLKVSVLLTWAQKDIVDNAHRVACPIFMSKATNSPFFEKKQNALEVMDILKKINKNFEYHTVEGTHHVHLNNPERLQGLIAAFLKKYDVEDRSVGGIKQEMRVNN